MSELTNKIRKCVENGIFRISSHGYDELANLATAEVLEEYPDYPIGQDEPAVLITAYRPDAFRWSEDFRRRKK